MSDFKAMQRNYDNREPEGDEQTQEQTEVQFFMDYFSSEVDSLDIENMSWNDVREYLDHKINQAKIEDVKPIEKNKWEWL